MGKNFRETLNEQLNDPEFKAEWDALTAERDAMGEEYDFSLLRGMKNPYASKLREQAFTEGDENGVER